MFANCMKNPLITNQCYGVPRFWFTINEPILHTTCLLDRLWITWLDWKRNHLAIQPPQREGDFSEHWHIYHEPGSCSSEGNEFRHRHHLVLWQFLEDSSSMVNYRLPEVSNDYYWLISVNRGGSGSSSSSSSSDYNDIAILQMLSVCVATVPFHRRVWDRNDAFPTVPAR